MSSKFIAANNATQVYNTKMSRLTTRPNVQNIRTTDQLLMFLAWEMNFINIKVTMDGEKPIVLYIGETLKVETKRKQVFTTIRSIEVDNVRLRHGKNIAVLAELYPFIDFHVFDSEAMSAYYCEDFKRATKKLKNIKAYNRMPTAKEYEYYTNYENLYLICNTTDDLIRNEPDYSELAKKELGDDDNDSKFYNLIKKMKHEFHELKEELNLGDLYKTKELILRLKPKSSLVKFRPNHGTGSQTAEFFAGTILLPIFSDYKSAECRMMIDPENFDNIITWNFEVLFENLNHWNDKERESLALNPFTGTPHPLGQLGNQMEICVLFAIIRDYFACTGSPFVTQLDADKLYNGMMIDEPENTDICLN